MKWIVVAIVAVIVPYTYLTLHYRKPGKAFQPYTDLKDRANTKRLVSSGFQRIALVAQRPSDPVRSVLNAPITVSGGGLPEALRASLIDSPQLPAEILNVSAVANLSADDPYRVQFSCSLLDNRQQLAGAALYLRHEEIYLVPTFERLTGDLLARTKENVVLLTIPAGTLKAGRYRAAVIGERTSRSWTVQVH